MNSADELFASDGPLAAVIPQYEPRPEQLLMARAVEEILEREGVLLAEAGTGTGKTLAYLLPAIVSGKTVVISTGTKNLQEQIYFKDVELLRPLIGDQVKIAYLKGQDNYLCQRRYAEFRSSPRSLRFKTDEVLRIERWYNQTVTGDRMELAELGDNDPLWNEVASTRETRIGPRCPYYDECYVTQARREALGAQIIVVNHHLYFADLATRIKGGSILPKHDAVIFDEAHMIEDIATEFFSVSVSSTQVRRTLNDAVASVRGARLTDDPAEDTRGDQVKNAKKAAEDFFSLFAGGQGKKPLVPGEISESQQQSYFRFDSTLDAVEQSLARIEGKEESIDHNKERLHGIRQDLDSVFSNPQAGEVHWVEQRPRSTSLGASPIDVSPMLRDGVFFEIPTVILTSATLSTNGDFKFLRSRLGIDFDAHELALDTPFDYQRQALLLVPRDLPDPRDASFTDAVADHARRLIELTGGGALVLFTSYRNMEAVHQQLERELDYPLLLQGSAPKSTLVADFKSQEGAVLLATASFWQGVDIPGEALRLVIIDKLPFASPADPLVAARVEHLTERNLNAFTEYQVPSAALTLKQGFGRLIRTRADRGIVAILDRRLTTKGYAKTFLRSLPDCYFTSDLSETSDWWMNP